jgi:predicted MPP superfamily phosphohydrolase
MDWGNLTILMLLAAGHAELLVMVINRLHGHALEEDRLHYVRHFHEVAIVVFPMALLWYVGLNGPQLLFGGRFIDLAFGWKIYLGLCAVGVVGLVISAVRWNLQHRPRTLVANHSQTIDIAQRLGSRPLADGPYRYLANVPGNEIFQLEVSDKTYRLPNLPAEWDGFSILHLTDLHYTGTIQRSFFEEVAKIARDMPADLVVMTGDLIDDERLIDWLPTTLGCLDAPLGCWFILGNHDWRLDSDKIRKAMTDLGWKDIASRTAEIEHNDHTLAIGGSEVPWMGRHPDFSETPDDAFRLLLSHTPDNLPWAKRNGVDLMLSGHNHGGQVVIPILGPVYAPSVNGVRHASGAFWEPPTQLIVSRGVSGKHPLRLNCKPELTRLILRAGA